MEHAETTERRTSSTAGNALRLLQLMATHPEGLGVAESANLLNIGRSSAHLLLSTLEHFRFASRARTGTYKLGIAAFEVGAALPLSLKFDEATLSGMRVLADRSGEAVSVSVQAGIDAIILKRIESTELLRAEIKVGTRMALHASASGKVLLAALSDDKLQALYPSGVLPASPHAKFSTVDELLPHVRAVREMGFAINANEFADGVVAIACPVADESGTVIAALSIAGPAHRFDPQGWLAPLKAAANSMF